VDSWRRRISQKVEDIQRLIESSKFESGDLRIDAIQKCTGDAQLVFVLLLSLTRHTREGAQPSEVPVVAVQLDTEIAIALEGLALRASDDRPQTIPPLADALNAYEHVVSATTTLNTAHFTDRLLLYRSLIAAMNELCRDFRNIGSNAAQGLSVNEVVSIQRQETQMN